MGKNEATNHYYLGVLDSYRDNSLFAKSFYHLQSGKSKKAPRKIGGYFVLPKAFLWNNR